MRGRLRKAARKVLEYFVKPAILFLLTLYCVAALWNAGLAANPGQPPYGPVSLVSSGSAAGLRLSILLQKKNFCLSCGETVYFEVKYDGTGTPEEVTLTALIFDIRGRRVKTVYAGRNIQADPRENAYDDAEEWDGNRDDGVPVPSGIYILKVFDSAGREDLAPFSLIR